MKTYKKVWVKAHKRRAKSTKHFSRTHAPVKGHYRMVRKK